MIFRFGTYSIKIKSYTPKEIGLDASFGEYLFQVYQKVFHIWFIPIFPVEKCAVIKDKASGKPTGKSTPKMRTALNLTMNKVKTPLWSYSGSFVLAMPFIAALCVLGMYFYDVSSDGITKAMKKSNRISQKEAFIEQPKLDDVYTFKVVRLEAVKDMNSDIVSYKSDPYYGTTRINYTVTYLSKDSIGFDLKQKKGYEIYQSAFKKELKLSKADLERAISKYQELGVLARESRDTKDYKMLTGVFEIKRGAQEVAGTSR